MAVATPAHAAVAYCDRVLSLLGDDVFYEEQDSDSLDGGNGSDTLDAGQGDWEILSSAPRIARATTSGLQSWLPRRSWAAPWTRWSR